MQRVAGVVALVGLALAALHPGPSLAEASPTRTGRVHGVVTDTQGAPVVGAAVRVWAPDCRGAQTHEEVGVCFAGAGRLREAGRARTDAQGRWAVDGLEAGEVYTVETAGPAGGVGARGYAWAVEGALHAPLRVRLQAGRPVHGRVVDDAGVGRQGFVAVTTWYESRAWAVGGSGTQALALQTPTAADGRFVVHVPAGHHARLDAHVPGLAAAGVVVPPGAGADASQPVDVPVALADGSAVEGTVRDDRGTPVAGARILVRTGAAHPWQYAAGASGYAETDADGRYVVAHLGGTAIASITVSAPDHVLVRLPRPVRGPLTGTPLTPERPFVADVVLPRARTLRGRVFDHEGKPVPHAWVRYTSPDVAAHAESRRTDAQGRFELWNVPTGPVRVHAGPDASAAGVSAAQGEDGGTPVPAGTPGAVTRVRIELPRGRTLRGTLQDETGTPLPGGRLFLYESGPRGGAVRSIAAWSGADGGFVFEGIRDGDLYYEIQADADGFVQTRTRVAREPGTFAVPLVVRMQRAGRVSGTVEDPGGAPLPGVRVWCGDVNRHAAMTDAQGRFALEGIAPGRHLLACGLGGAVLVQRSVELTPGGHASGQRLRLAAQHVGTHAIGGIVVDAEDRPVAGETVTVARVPPQGGSKTVRTDGEGRFRVTQLPAGSYTVTSRWPTRRPPVFDAGATDVRLVVPGRRVNVLEGVVVDTHGARVPGGHVELAFAGDGANTVRGGSALYGGRFRLGVPVGVTRVILRARAPADALGRRLDLMETELSDVKVGTVPVRIELPPALSIRGIVHDAEGRGVPHARLTAVPADRPPYDRRPGYTALCDERGRFTVSGLQDRPYRLTTLASDDFAPSADVTAKAGAADVHIPVDRFRRFFGRLVDDEGKPVEGASVAAMGRHRREGVAIPYRPGQKTSFNVKTDADGRFAIPRMPPAFVYDVWFHLPIPIKPHFFPVKLERHDPTGKAHDVTLRRGLPIAGRLTTPEGKGVQGATVDSSGPIRDGKYDPALRRQAYTLPDGRFVIGPYPAGAKVTLRFDLRGVRIRKPATPWIDPTQDGVTAGTQDLDVVLSTGVTVRGRIEGATPEELKDVSLALSSAAAPGSTQRPLRRHFRFDGSTAAFAFHGLRPGAYVLTTWGSHKVQLPSETEVRAPAEDIVLVRRTTTRLHGTLLGAKDPQSYTAVFHPLDGRRRGRPVRVKKDRTFDLGPHVNNPGVLLISGRARSHVVYMRLTPSEKPVVAKAVEAKTIRGRILGLPHKIHGGRVVARDGPVSFLGTVADDGWFEIRGLPAGAWTLTVTASRPTGGTFEVANPVEAGTQNVRVRWR